MSPQPSQPLVPAPAPFFQRKATRRTLFAILLILLVAVVATLVAAVNLRHDLTTSLPQLNGTLAIAGLTAPVTVTRDDHAVPTIHAATLDDLLFAQGYITASDRLFQMDALRRHGSGELAELLGSSLIPHDRLQRYLQIRATADRAVALLPSDQLHQLQAYANGVNAFIANAGKHSSSAQDLPVEFHLLHYTPGPWQPRDSLIIALVMSQDLATEWPSKLNREALMTHLPASLIPDLYPVGSWRDHAPSQPTTDLTTPTDSINQIPLDRTQSRNQPPTTAPTDLLAVTTALHAALCEGCRFGSNNWVVAGAHTATGAPLLSNDMHLGLTAPDIWYEAGLHTVGLDVTGFTLPGVPFVIVGRNPYLSWGFTNSGADVQDVFIEHLRKSGSPTSALAHRGEGSANDTEFEHPDGTWSAATHHTEIIHVRAARDLTLDVLTTTHTIGDRSIPTPIITPLLHTEHRALALAWTVYDASTVTSPMYAINTATDAASLVAAFAGFGSVSQNLVYADAHHIGYHTIGRIPVRGPATQHPRAVAPFVLPDDTPPEDNEDDEDESSSLHSPLVCHPEATCIRSAGHLAPASLAFRPAAARFLAVAHKVAAAAPQSDTTTTLSAAPTTPYTIGSPISPVPIDALDVTQTWSGYIPYDQLPSVLDPASGLIATANSRIVTDAYPYFIANDWVDPYRVERIYHLLANRSNLTPADMLSIQTDTHSELDLLVAHRLAYALDHAPGTRTDPRLRQAADLLRDFDGNMTTNSPAAAIVSSTRAALWPLLLAPHLREQAAAATPRHRKLSGPAVDDLIALYDWSEKTTALEQLLQHTPARWLPRAYPTWNDFLAYAVQQGLKHDNAPANLSLWTYGTIHTIDIAHPIFGSTGIISKLLGTPTGTGPQPYAGDGTTVKQAGHAFGPSERFTADLADPNNTHANITTGQSGNPSSPWFLDQFQAWLKGTTFTLPLTQPHTTHTLTLTPQ